MTNKKIAVVGGGLAGTAAAHTLNQLGYDVTIFEKHSEVGGRIQSRKYKGENYELGAAFVTKGIYKRTFKILEEANLLTDLRYRRSKYTLVKNGRFITPNDVLNSSWLTVGAKVELAKVFVCSLHRIRTLKFAKMTEAVIFDNEDSENLFRPKYRKQISDYLLDPLLDGYCYWSPRRTSKATLLVFAREALLKGRTYTLKNGLQQIPKFLSIKSNVVTNCEVQKVFKLPGSKYEVIAIRSGKTEKFSHFDGIICATTANVVPKIFTFLSYSQKEFFNSVSYSSTVNVARCYERVARTKSQAIVFPTAEGKPFSSIVTDSGESNSGNFVEVIKSYANGKYGGKLCTKTTKDILKKMDIPSSLKIILQDTEKPGEIRVQKWPEALPEFKVGHITRLKEFSKGYIETDTIAFAGDYIGGPYIDGAIRSGQDAATRLHNKLLATA